MAQDVDDLRTQTAGDAAAESPDGGEYPHDDVFVNERLQQALDYLNWFVSQPAPETAALAATVEELRAETRRGLHALHQQLKIGLSGFGERLAEETGDLRAHLYALTDELIQAVPPSVPGPEPVEPLPDGGLVASEGAPDPSGGAPIGTEYWLADFVQAELAQQRGDLVAALDAAVKAALAGVADPQGPLWQRVRADLEGMLGRSTDQLRAHLAQGEQLLRNQIAAALAGALDRNMWASEAAVARFESTLKTVADRLRAELLPKRDEEIAAVAAAAVERERVLAARLGKVEATVAAAAERIAADLAEQREAARAEAQATRAALAEKAAPAARSASSAGSSTGSPTSADVVEAARTEVRATVAALRQEQAEALRTLRAEIQSTLAAARREQAASSEAWRADASETLEIVRRDHADAASAAKAEMASALGAVRREHEQALAAWRADLASAVDTIRREQREAAEAVHHELRAVLDHLRPAQAPPRDTAPHICHDGGPELVEDRRAGQPSAGRYQQVSVAVVSSSSVSSSSTGHGPGLVPLQRELASTNAAALAVELAAGRHDLMPAPIEEALAKLFDNLRQLEAMLATMSRVRLVERLLGT